MALPPEDIFASAMGSMAKLMNPLSSLSNSNIDPDEAAMKSRISGMQSKLAEAGIDSELNQPRENLFWKTLNFIAKPMQAVEGVVDSAFVRKDLPNVGLLGAISRGWDERITGSDILRRAGVRSPVARGVAGFGLDFALDPLGFLKFGTKGLSTVGSAVLSPKGDALRKTVVKGFDNAFTEFAKTGADDIAKAGLVFQQEENLFEGFRALKEASKDVLNTKRAIYGGEKALYGEKAQRLLDLAKTKLGVDVGTLDDIPDLLAKPSVRIEMGVPFLGHFKGKKSTDLSKLSSTFQKTLGAAGNVLKPDTLKLGSFEIPEALTEAVVRTGNVAREGIAKVQARAIKALDSVQEAASDSVLGTVIEKSRGAAEAVAGLGKAVGNALAGTFGRTFLIGETGRDAELTLQRRLGALDTLGQDLMLKTFPEVSSEQGRAILNGLGVKVDALAFDVMDKNIDTLGKDIRKNLLENLNRLARGIEVPEGSFDDLKALERPFRERLDALKATLTPEEISIVDRYVGSTDAMIKNEQAYGIPTSFFEYYLPHRYENLSKVQALKGKRTFATLGEAWDKANLVPSTDVGSLWFRRWKASEERIMRGQYNNRMWFEGGFNAETVGNLYKQARFQPDSAEAALLKRAAYDPSIITKDVEKLLNEEKLSFEARRTLKRLGLNLDDPLTPAQVEKGKLVSQAKKDAITNFGHIAPYIPNKDDLISEATDVAESLRGQGAQIDLPIDTGIKDEIAQAITRTHTESFHAHMESGIKPFSSEMPDPYYKEMSGFVDEVVGPNGEKVRHVLPVQMARALEENLKSKDVIKEALKGSPLGTAVLGLIDGATNLFKKWNTLPWPGYWSQNLFGDSVMRWIDGGISALDPGLMAKTYDLVGNPNAVLDIGGRQLSGKAFQEYLKRSGIHIEAQEMIDTMNAAGDLNIQKWLDRRGKGVSDHAKSIMKLEKGSVGNALTASRELVTKNFENFFRVNHVVHRLSMGDTLADAVRNATEAMINYRDFTPIEKSVLRRFYMFYGWTSKAIKKQAISLFTNPGDIQNQVKLARNFAEMFSEPGALPSPEDKDDELLRSVTQKEQLAFGLGKNKEGKEVIGRGFGMPLNVPLQQFTLNLPRTWSASEIISTVGDNFSRNIQKQAASANPVISMAAEALAGKNLYFDKPFSAKFLRKLPDWTGLAEKIAPFPYSSIPAEALNAVQAKLLGAVPDGKGNYIADPGKYYLATHLIPGFGRAISTAKALSSKTIPGSLGALRALSGLRIEESEIERSGLFDEQQRLQDLMNQYSVKERLEQDDS